jgi:hypothetical protein
MESVDWSRLVRDSFEGAFSGEPASRARCLARRIKVTALFAMHGERERLARNDRCRIARHVDSWRNRARVKERAVLVRPGGLAGNRILVGAVC